MFYNRVLQAHRPPTITIQLVGGLGNQLFGYFAGIYWARLNNGRVRFIRSSQEKHSSKTRSSVLDFELPSQKFVSNTFLNRFLSRIRARESLLRTKFGNEKSLLSNFFPIPYFSTQTGFDPNLESLPAGSCVEGYFQTYRYFLALRQQGLFSEVRVKEPCPWYVDAMNRADLEKPIVLHIRRGDYKNLSSSLGLIGPEYYTKALEIAHQHAPNSKVWVFTDDRESLDSEFLGDEFRNVIWIRTPPEATAAEIMMLMSRGSVIVISNSTFSWWAATLGKPRKVIAPSEWFKAGNEPEELIPFEWIRIPSHWE